MDMCLSKLWEIVEDEGAWHNVVHGVTKTWTRLSDWTELNWELIFGWLKEKSQASGAGFCKSLPISNELRRDTTELPHEESPNHMRTQWERGHLQARREGPHQNPTVQTSWSMPSGFQKFKDINVCGLSHHSMAFCHSRLNRWTEIALWAEEEHQLTLFHKLRQIN